MTGLEGNWLSVCPLRFRIASPTVSNNRGAAEVNRNSWGGDSESQAYYPGTSHYLFYYTIMLLKEKNFIILIGSLLVLPLGLITKNTYI